MKGTSWTVKNIVDVIKQRQENEFDGNIAVSGDRGNGKSTLIAKILYRLGNFKPWIHQVYNREDVIKLLQEQEYGICWDDEAINSGYKRNFQEKAQQELIKILTAYRDNYNVFASAIPSFFSLDKDLRDLYFIHLHLIERGIAVVHIPLQGKLYSQDRWDSKYNSKVEDKWSKKLQKDPKYRIPYHRLTTFRGFLFFEDLTTLQRELYKKIKREKRKQSFKTTTQKVEEVPFLDKVYGLIMENKIDTPGLEQVCLIEGKKYGATVSALNRMLRDKGIVGGLSQFMVRRPKHLLHSNNQESIKNLIPVPTP